MANFNVDSSGNLWVGTNVSDTFSTALGQAATKFYVTSAGSILASAGSIGGIDLAATHIQSSNYSNTSGSEAGFKINSNGNAEFNNVTVRGDLLGVELKGQMVFNGGDIKTSTTGTRVEILDNSGIEGEIRFETSTGTTARLVADAATEFTIEQSALSSGKIKLITGTTSDGLQFTGNEINITTPLSSGNPVIKLNGTNANSAGTSTLSKLLGVDSSGRLAVGSSTSGVSSISVTGELQLSGSSGVLNINHNDSDHDDQYYTKSNVNTLLGNKDNYGNWVLKGGGNNLNVLSGYGVEFKAGSGISLSVNTSPYEITFSHGGGTHVSSSTAVQALFPGGIRGSVTLGSGTTGRFFNGIGQSGQNYTWNTTGTFNGTPTFSGSINVGTNIFHPTPNDGVGFIGFSSNRFNRLYASNGVSTTSDERLKQNIENIPYGLDYLNSLRPVQFEWIPKHKDECTICGCIVEQENENCENCWEDVQNEEGEIIDKTYCACETVSIDITGDKKLWGFIAQELIETPPEPNIDVELIDYDNENDSYNMNYSQLIAPLVKAVQELSTQISDLNARIEVLEG